MGVTGSGRRDRDGRGRRALLVTEGFERFGYCGTQLLMLLYLAALFGDEAASGPLRAQTAALFGPGEPLALATQVAALFMAGSQLAALGGAVLARVVDTRIVVASGGALMAAGHFAMAEPALVPLALLLLPVGCGCTIGNKLVQFGQLLGREGSDRARGYAGYTMALNAGVLLAPLICGTLAERWGWAWGFRAAGVGMVAGLACYLLAWRSLPAASAIAPRVRHGASDRRARIAAILLLLVPYVLALFVINQAYALAMLWGAAHVAREVGGFTIPITWVLTIDGLGSIAGLILARWVWQRFARAGRPLSDLARFAIGCALLAVPYLALSGIATLPAPSFVLFAGFFLLLDLTTGWIDAPVEAFTSRHAPPADVGLMMGALKTSGVVAALLLGWSGRWFTTLGAPAFWAVNAAVAGGAALLVLALWPWLTRLSGHADAEQHLAFAGDAQRARQAGDEEAGVQQPG